MYILPATFLTSGVVRRILLPMKIRDNRAKEWFWLDNEYLNGYAKELGIACTVVYLSLCRHANNETQTCFPSMKLIAEENAISTRTVIRATQDLEKWGIITIQKDKKKDGTQANNIYTLTAKSEWKNKPSDSQSHGQPSDKNDDSRVTPEPYNKTNTNNTKISETSSQVYEWEKYLQGMLDNKRKDLNIIGFYFKEKRLSFDTKAKADTAVRRHLRAAKSIMAFDKPEIGNIIRKLAYDFPRFTIETVYKELTK